MRVGFWIAVSTILAVALALPSSAAPPNWPASLAIGTALEIGATIRNGPWNAQGQQLRSGQLDVFASAIGVPIPNFAELDADGTVEFVAPDDKEIAKLHEAIPELTASVVPAGSYPRFQT